MLIKYISRYFIMKDLDIKIFDTELFEFDSKLVPILLLDIID